MLIRKSVYKTTVSGRITIVNLSLIKSQKSQDGAKQFASVEAKETLQKIL